MRARGPKVAGIYAITHRASGKAYIGSALNIAKRWQDHRHFLKKGLHDSRHLQSAWVKYGPEAFEFSLIEISCNVSNILRREQHWMDITQCYDRKRGYNTCTVAGNCYGKKHSEDARRKMSATKRGKVLSEETKMKMSEAHKGKVRSDEHRKNLSKSLIGRKMDPSVVEKVRLKLVGRQLSDEHKAKIKAAFDRKRAEREAAKALEPIVPKPPRQKRVHSEETKRKIGAANAIALRGKKQSPERVANRAEKLRGRKLMPHQIEAMRAGKLLGGTTDETREKMRKSRYAYIEKQKLLSAAPRDLP